MSSKTIYMDMLLPEEKLALNDAIVTLKLSHPNKQETIKWLEQILEYPEFYTDDDGLNIRWNEDGSKCIYV